VKITQEGGYKLKYGKKLLQIPEGSVLNGDVAQQALQDKAGLAVSYETKVTPFSQFKAVKTTKKALNAAPENKSLT
jgi:hypothetical protein